jgi:uncharacterized coiled-coil protein SlyX
MNKIKHPAVLVGISLSVLAIILSLCIGIPLYLHNKSLKAESLQKSNIESLQKDTLKKKIDTFESDLASVDSKPALEIQDLDGLALAYEEICTACKSFISKNGFSDKVASLRPKASILAKDLFKTAMADKETPAKINKLLGLGLLDAQFIIDIKKGASGSLLPKVQELNSKLAEANEKVSKNDSKISEMEQELKDLSSLIIQLKNSLTEAKSKPIVAAPPPPALDDIFETDSELKQAKEKFISEPSRSNLLGAYNLCKMISDTETICSKLFALLPHLDDSVNTPAKIIALRNSYSGDVICLRPAFLDILVSIIENIKFCSLSDIDTLLQQILYEPAYGKLLSLLAPFVDKWLSTCRATQLEDELLTYFDPPNKILDDLWAKFLNKTDKLEKVFVDLVIDDKGIEGTGDEKPAKNPEKDKEYFGLLQQHLNNDFNQIKIMIHQLLDLIAKTPFSEINLADPRKIMLNVMLADQLDAFTSFLTKTQFPIPKIDLGPLTRSSIPTVEKIFEILGRMENSDLEEKYKAFKYFYRMYRTLSEIELLESILHHLTPDLKPSSDSLEFALSKDKVIRPPNFDSFSSLIVKMVQLYIDKDPTGEISKNETLKTQLEQIFDFSYYTVHTEWKTNPSEYFSSMRDLIEANKKWSIEIYELLKRALIDFRRYRDLLKKTSGLKNKNFVGLYGQIDKIVESLIRLFPNGEQISLKEPNCVFPNDVQYALKE